MPTPPDPRDAAFINTVVAANIGLIVAAHQGDALALIGHVAVLLTAIVEHNAVLGDERPDDAPLRRAIERLSL